LTRQRDAHCGDLSGVGNQLFGPRVYAGRHPGIQQALEQARDQRGAGDAQMAGSFIDRRMQPGSGFGVETDV
jgi:hypothetical protein